MLSRRRSVIENRPAKATASTLQSRVETVKAARGTFRVRRDRTIWKCGGDLSKSTARAFELVGAPRVSIVYGAIMQWQMAMVMKMGSAAMPMAMGM